MNVMQSQWKAHYKISINTKMASRLKFRKYPSCQSNFGLNSMYQRNEVVFTKMGD